MLVESRPGNQSDKKDFQIPGDSGSLAFTSEGKLAGLSFMSTQDGIRGAFSNGHFIPVGELLADIEQAKLGAKGQNGQLRHRWCGGDLCSVLHREEHRPALAGLRNRKGVSSCTLYPSTTTVR